MRLELGSRVECSDGTAGWMKRDPPSPPCPRTRAMTTASSISESHIDANALPENVEHGA